MMLLSAILLLVLTTVAPGAAFPVAKRAGLTDISILQYALTHLENAFYKNALSNISVPAFTAAGFSASFYNQIKYMAHDEEAHVLYLEAGLKAVGVLPVAACFYSFPMSTPLQFIQMASVIEGLGVSAYLGAASLIANKAYLTAAGSKLVTEAIHQGAHRNAISEVPTANVFGTPLGLNAIYGIASTFIMSCPSNNSVLPLTAYPSLTLVSRQPTAVGADIVLKTHTELGPNCYATFVSGLDILVAKVRSNGSDTVTVQVPLDMSGQAYVFITKNKNGNVTDANVICGPAAIEVTPSSPTFNLTII